MKAALLRAIEILLLGGAFFCVVPPLSSDGESYPLFPRLGIAGAFYAGSLALALARKAENTVTAVVKFAGFLVFGWLLHLHYGYA